MKVFRFMSTKEFIELLDGKILKNTTEHKAKTNSVGFCFLRYDDFKPEDAIHFLSGVANIQKCVVFEVDESKLKETWGEYADHTHTKPTGDLALDFFNLIHHFNDTFKTREYCTTEYSLNDFKIIEYTTPKYFEEKWNWKKYDRQ